MKVSVIMPVYNTEKYLPKSLDSLLKQTLEGVEIVAVDDGSTDGCGAILDRLQSKFPDRMKVFHKENGGQASARNLALQHCSGEYIGFLDSDDSVEPDMFEEMYRAARESDADYVACGYRDTTYVDGQQVVLKEYVASKTAHNPKEMFFDALVSPWLHMYKKSVILDHHVIFPEGLIYEDTAFYLNAIPHIHKVAVVEKPMATRVRRKNSTMTICRSEKVAQIMPVLQNSITYYQENGFYGEYASELEYFCVRILLCSSMERIAKVKPFREGWHLVRQTRKFISENFPDFRKNPHMTGSGMHLYMKSFCGFTAGIYYPVFRLKARFERRYE